MTRALFQYLQKKRFFSRFYLDFKIGIRIRKPKLIIRLLYNYLVLIIFRKRLLRSVDLAPTYSCNMNCEHCFSLPMLDDKKELMTLSDYKNVALQAKKLGAVHFAFQGGEPLILYDLEEMIKSINPSDCFVSITTNGLLLTEERLLKLKKAGIDMITISIDSGYPQEHDNFRKKEGSFKKAVDAIKIAKGHNMIVTVNTVITHKTIASGGFEEIVKLCSKLKVKLNLLFPAIAGRWVDRTDLMLSQQEKTLVNEIISRYTFIRRDLDANYLSYGCGAVKEMIYISPYGEVMPCSFIHLLLGNVKNDSLKSCIEKGLKIPYFSSYYPVCPPMEDVDFINKFISGIAKSKILPARLEDIFGSIKKQNENINNR